jgi:hypothetical protein
MVSSAVQKSPTVDEQSHLFRGIAYIKAEATQFLWGHPLLAGGISALPLLTVTDLRLPEDEPAWVEGDWAVAGDSFLWRLNPDPQRLIFLGRLSTMWITLLLGALIFRWGRELSGRTAGIIALALVALDPNVLAHGRLVTSDLPLAFFLTASVYSYWRWASITEKNHTNIGIKPLLCLGIGGMSLGAAAATKFNAALVLPALGLLALFLALRRRNGRPVAGLAFMGLAAWITVWVVYSFDSSPLPGGAFWDDLVWQFDYLSRPHGAYLLGRSDPWGWWYYFPLAFLVKTPLPTLILSGWAILSAFRSKRKPSPFLWLPPLIYFAISLFSPLNIGYRHLIPLLPFLALFIADTLPKPRTLRPLAMTASRLAHLAPAAMTFMVVVSSILAWPDYIPFFNVLVKWSEGNWRILSDSNIDWGQDLPALAEWQKRSGEMLKLSYFGVAHPSAYGLNFSALPTWEPGPEQVNPAHQSFNPADPAPGVYAISVTNLHGLVLGAGQDTFAWFREREPEARIGGSIFIYRVEPTGNPVQVGFAGLRPAEVEPTLQALWPGNDLKVRWFDARTSFIWPAGGGWLAVAGQTPEAALQPFWPSEPSGQAGGQRLYQVFDSPTIAWDGQTAEAGNILTFSGYRMVNHIPGEIGLLTAWKVEEATDRPLKIFVHALDLEGNIAGQWDGLDVEPGSWQPGDIIIQLHRFAVPVTADPLRLTTGIYDGATLERLAGPISLE